MRDPLIVHHYDADGISAAAIVCKAREHAGKAFRTKSSKPITAEDLPALSKEKELIFVDLGAGQLDLIEGLDAECVIIDHHPASRRSELPQANPREHGFDGTREACAATAAYYCFNHAGASGLAELGITGAVGDMQHLTGLIGLNERMLDEAVEEGTVLHERDLRVLGRSTKPLIQLLSECTSPCLPELTGDEQACALFLTRSGFPLKRGSKELKYYDLEPPERKRLVGELIKHCTESSLSPEDVKSLVGDVYLFPNEPSGSAKSDAAEYAALLNACGRRGEAQIGVDACLGKAGALEHAKGFLAAYYSEVSDGINFARNSFIDAGPYYLIDARGFIPSEIIGIVASAFLDSGSVKRTKPVIALSSDGGTVKASARGTARLVESGLDLSEAFRKAGKAANGRGGGHDIASGCAFPDSPENEAAFLKKAKDVIEIQLEFR
jgi:RecJ-like exonuclease